MGLLINLDGVIAPTATVSVLDRGFLYGDSVYEVVRTFGGRPFGLPEHLERLRQSAAYLYMEIPWSDAEISQEVSRTLDQAGAGDFYIRIVVTRGTESRINLLPGPQLRPHLIVIIASLETEPLLSETGVHLAIASRQRNPREALDPVAKTGNYLNNILALLEAQQQGADDALMLNAKGEVTEATTSNFWVIKAGIVQTPNLAAGMLHGITRQFILQILQTHQIPYQEVRLQAADLKDAEEAFLSSSVRLLMPVNRIDNWELPHCPGPLTRFLWQEFLALMARSP